MKLDTFFDNFELLAEAPNGVEKLRELILQLAVMGKLVAQDENDEPAEVLLEKIREEKERLVKEGKISKSRLLSPIKPEEIPYQLSRGWKWLRLSDVCHDLGQKKPDEKFTYIDVSSIDNGKGIISDSVKILEPHEAPSRARKIVREGTLIYSTVRPYLLNIAIIDKKFEPKPIVSTAFAVLHPFLGIYNKYLYYYLCSKPFIEYVESEMTGMAYPAINDGKLYRGLVPVPPSKEQRRIVARVDQLMSLCDELEARREKKHKLRARLNSAALDRLTSAPGAENWRRISDNFDMLYDNAESVGELRKAILQLAVMGKLVAQDKNDEPTEVLLEKIRKEKLVRVKQIKKAFKSTIEPNKIPYILPASWQWVSLGEICQIVGGGTPKTSNLEYFAENGIPWLTPADLYAFKRKYIKRGRRDISELGLQQSSAQLMPAGAVLFSSRAPIGYVAIAENELATNQGFKSCVPIIMELNEYLYYFLKKAGKEIEQNATGTTFKEISGKDMSKILCPLPPLAEQRRIVARVDQLMSLCDELEARLARSEEEAGRLVEAVVSEMV